MRKSAENALRAKSKLAAKRALEFILPLMHIRDGSLGELIFINTPLQRVWSLDIVALAPRLSLVGQPFQAAGTGRFPAPRFSTLVEPRGLESPANPA
jgi:hypothetical protein